MAKFRYNINNILVTSPIPLFGETQLSMTDDEAKHCIGFNNSGSPIYNQVAIDHEVENNKKKQVDNINLVFMLGCTDIGIDFEGNKYQYDDVSRSRLLETKDDSRVTFWRSVDNVNVTLSNTKKNELYELLKLTYYTKFAEKSAQIDVLRV